MVLQHIVFVTVALCLKEIAGHGMMLDPPNRSSLWRFDKNAPTNVNDNEYFCGGFNVQYKTNGGKCGVCGDNYADPSPRSNENTGKYGQGKIVATYQQGSVLNISILITANHLGSFRYSLCDLKDSSKPEPENCFNDLLFADGSTDFKIYANDYKVQNSVRLPKGVTCKHCVLRWHYTCGNNWGICPDGKGAIGCGIQENFYSCSDISIV